VIQAAVDDSGGSNQPSGIAIRNQWVCVTAQARPWWGMTCAGGRRLTALLIR
jgi:hypothetical protein